MTTLKWNFQLVDLKSNATKSLKTLNRISPNANAILKNLFTTNEPLTITMQLNPKAITVELTGDNQKQLTEFLQAAHQYGLQLRLEMLTDSFEVRKVQYEKLHDVENNDFYQLVNSLELKDGMEILDMMCGYGAVGEKVLECARANQKDIKVHFCDLHETQLNRMKPEVRNQAVEVKIGDARQAPFADNRFDAIVIKMGVHDVPQYDQLLIFQEAYRMLKPGGVFAIWEVLCDDAETQDAFSSIIRKKDILAGYESYVCDRYFLRENQAYGLFKDAKFQEIEKVSEVRYLQSTLARKDSELNGDEDKLTSLNNYIRQLMTPKLKEQMKYEEHGNDITFIVPNRIMRGKK